MVKRIFFPNKSPHDFKNDTKFYVFVNPSSVVSSGFEKGLLPFYVVHFLRIDFKTSINTVLRRKGSLDKDNFNFFLPFFMCLKLNCKMKGTLYICIHETLLKLSGGCSG